MPIYNISTDGIIKVPQTNFQANGILERNHLQKFLSEKIDIISDGTLIISEEFADGEIGNINNIIELAKKEKYNIQEK